MVGRPRHDQLDLAEWREGPSHFEGYSRSAGRAASETQPSSLAGQESGSTQTGMISPQHVVEQKEAHKADATLKKGLKCIGNGGAYGPLVELNDQRKGSEVKLNVYSGEHYHQQKVREREVPRPFYFPPVATSDNRWRQASLGTRREVRHGLWRSFISFVIPTPSASW